MCRSRKAALGGRSWGSSHLPKTPRWQRKEQRSTSTCCRARCAARFRPDAALPSLLCLTADVCSPQLWSPEGAKQKVGAVRFTDSAAEEKFQQMQKEIKEQERLLQGYQQVSSSSSSVPASPVLGGITLTYQ